MSYLVCHAQKFKQSDLRGVEIHNNRESSNSKNKDIDYSRTKNNFDALTGLEGNPKVNYREMVEKRIREGYRGKKAVRKDAVKLVSIIISSDKDFFKDMSKDEIKKFFKVSATYLTGRFGAENVVGAKVHMDEYTPHMHFTFVPLRDGKLTAKTILDRKSLIALQDELPLRLQEEGFKIDRGQENNPVKHLEVLDFKRLKNSENVKGYQVANFLERLDRKAVKKKDGLFGKVGKDIVQITTRDYQVMMSIARDYIALKADYGRALDREERLKYCKVEAERAWKVKQEIRELERYFPTELADLRTRLEQKKERQRQAEKELERYYQEKIKWEAPKENSSEKEKVEKSQKIELEKYEEMKEIPKEIQKEEPKKKRYRRVSVLRKSHSNDRGKSR